MKTTETEKNGCREAYLRNATEIRLLLDGITDKLVSHAVAANADPGNWGFAGSLGHVRAELADVLQFLGGDPAKAAACAARYVAESKKGGAA